MAFTTGFNLNNLIATLLTYRELILITYYYLEFSISIAYLYRLSLFFIFLAYFQNMVLLH